MTDRSKLKLHPGSRWNEDASITDQSGDAVCVYVSACGESSLAADDGAYIEDALAVIRAAGLDPEFKELEEAREMIIELERKLSDALVEIDQLERSAQMDAQIVQAVRETCHDFEDRLEAANKTISEMQDEINRLVRSEGTIW